MLLTIGSLLLAVALWRARAVPRGLVIAFAATDVLPTVTPFGLLLDLASVAFSTTLILIAWYLWQRPAPTAPGPT